MSVATWTSWVNLIPFSSSYIFFYYFLLFFSTFDKITNTICRMFTVSDNETVNCCHVSIYTATCTWPICILLLPTRVNWAARFVGINKIYICIECNKCRHNRHYAFHFAYIRLLEAKQNLLNINRWKYLNSITLLRKLSLEWIDSVYFSLKFNLFRV